MAVTDDKTPHLAIPLPHPSNLLEDDVLRLRMALNGIDTEFAKKGVAGGYANQGGGGAHNNTQPTIVLNYIIKA